jgi:predicted NBD/HSP70 family sugar kinase
MTHMGFAVRPDEIRRHNLGLLLRQVHLHGELSRAQLTHVIGLNRSTIRALVTDLTEHRLVQEHLPATRSGAGRPSHVVGPRTDGPFVLAAAVGVESLVTAAIGLSGTVLSRRDQSLDGAGSMPSAVAGRIIADLRHHLRHVPQGARLVGLGVSVPGIVREIDGFIELAPNLKWQSVPFARMLADRLPARVPVRIGNDGDLGALAEHVRGAARTVDDAVYVAGDVGVGGGIITAGASLRGSGGYAGEIGHMLVDPMGDPCGCGSTGCFETKVGEVALMRACGRSEQHGGRAILDLYSAARAGDPVTLAGVESVAGWLGRGLASVVNVFNPRMLIVGGSLAGLVELARPSIEAQLDRHVMPSLRTGLELRLPGLGGDSSLIGAMEIGFEALLDDPSSSGARAS